MRSIALDLADGVILSGSYDKSVKVWDMMTGECLRTIEGHESLVFGVGLIHGRLISSVGSSSAEIWKVVDGVLLGYRMTGQHA